MVNLISQHDGNSAEMTSCQSSPTIASAAKDEETRDTVPRPTNELHLLLILSALMSFASISTDIYLPALPTIGRALRVTSAGIELTFSAFLVGFSLGQLLWGPISDRCGRRIPIAVGMVLFTIGSMGCAMSTTVTQMMGWRVIQALGACVGPVLSRAIVRDLYGRERSARMLSTLILIMGIAPLLGPLVGGQILLFWSWQGIFWTLAGVGLLTLVSLLALPESLPVSQRSTTPLWQSLSDYLDLVQDVRLMRYALSGGFFYAGAYAFIVGTPFVYIEYYHVSPQSYGWLFAVNIAGMMAANFINGRLLRQAGSERPFHIGTWIVALSGLTLIVNAWSGWGGMIGLSVPIFFYMSMNGLIVANSVAGALANFPHKAGSASSLLGAMHYGSGILSAAMVGWFANGKPWTMAWIMGLAGFGSLATSAISVRIRTANT
ncbi:DHA1 family bicyclomycin/chloramphenicol resistance-like MFS transporter [Paraburkholderia sp. RAU6.4a]|uniref:Bcr/CflA family multidrug efflux MFS transporter n=1 Tax=Paraburkholderia sp. RAU6.4a TaxID=2991067 RepID=UPI003D20D777